MTLQTEFVRFVRLGREAVTWGTSPALGTLEYNAAGGWFSVPTTSPLGALKYLEAKIENKGAMGKRSMHQRVHVAGGQHSEGGLEFPYLPTVGGLLFTAALGGDSASTTTDAAIKASTSLSASPQTISSFDAQPTATKYDILKITIGPLVGAATFDATGKVVVTGTDANDATITETITFGALAALSTTVVYTQQNFKTFTTVVLTGFVAGGGSGTVTLDGVNYVTHTITAADTSTSLAIEDFGDPSAGSGKSWTYNGMVQGSTVLTFSSLDEESLLMISSPQLRGKYPTAATASVFVNPYLLPWAGWTASVTKGGSSYARIQNATITLTPGQGLMRSAMGVQNPQGQSFLSRMLRVTGQLYLDDNTEYTAWKGNTSGAYVFTFTSPWKLTDAIYQDLVLTMSEMVFKVYNPKPFEGFIVADFEAYTLENTTNNVLKIVQRDTKVSAY